MHPGGGGVWCVGFEAPLGPRLRSAVEPFNPGGSREEYTGCVLCMEGGGARGSGRSKTSFGFEEPCQPVGEGSPWQTCVQAGSMRAGTQGPQVLQGAPNRDGDGSHLGLRHNLVPEVVVEEAGRRDRLPITRHLYTQGGIQIGLAVPCFGASEGHGFNIQCTTSGMEATGGHCAASRCSLWGPAGGGWCAHHGGWEGGVC